MSDSANLTPDSDATRDSMLDRFARGLAPTVMGVVIAYDAGLHDYLAPAFIALVVACAGLFVAAYNRKETTNEG